MHTHTHTHTFSVKLCNVVTCVSGTSVCTNYNKTQSDVEEERKPANHRRNQKTESECCSCVAVGPLHNMSLFQWRLLL